MIITKMDSVMVYNTKLLGIQRKLSYQGQDDVVIMNWKI
jgi:hypothetical protein